MAMQEEEPPIRQNLEGSKRRVPQVSLLRPGIPATDPKWNRHPLLCHPACPGVPWEQPTCLRQVKGGMNMGKRCLQSRPRGPAPKISPARKGWAHKAGGRAPEVRHHTLRLFIRSAPGFPTSQLSPAPLMWFSLKRTTWSCPNPQLSTENPGEPTCPGAPWRDLQFLLPAANAAGPPDWHPGRIEATAPIPSAKPAPD
jgi:hypothetical protein